MEINKETSFIETYFDDKSGEELLKTITPSWNSGTLSKHLYLVSAPSDARHILEIGSGVGRILNAIDNENRVSLVGLDASSSMIKEGYKIGVGPHVLLAHCDGDGTIPEHLAPTNGYDFSFSIITFQHIPNTETVKKYISEMIRVTRPGGEIMFQVLCQDLDRGFLWSYHDVDDLHHFIEDKTRSIKRTKHSEWEVFRCMV